MQTPPPTPQCELFPFLPSNASLPQVSEPHSTPLFCTLTNRYATVCILYSPLSRRVSVWCRSSCAARLSLWLCSADNTLEAAMLLVELIYWLRPNLLQQQTRFSCWLLSRRASMKCMTILQVGHVKKIYPIRLNV